MARFARRGMTLVELLVVIAIIAVLAGLLLPAILQARGAGRKIQCESNLKQLAQAVQTFHHRNNSLPVYWGPMKGGGGEKFGGWLLHLLPDMEQQVLYDMVPASTTSGWVRVVVSSTTVRYSPPRFLPAIPASSDYQPGEWQYVAIGKGFVNGAETTIYEWQLVGRVGTPATPAREDTYTRDTLGWVPSTSAGVAAEYLPLARQATIPCLTDTEDSFETASNQISRLFISRLFFRKTLMRPFSVSATGCPWQPKSVAFRRVHNPAIRVATLAACLFAIPAAFAQTSEAWDAKFVKMEVPDSVEADAVFVAKVTMENTGSEKWREGRDITPSSLRSQPDKDMTWGTTIFIQGQGTVVEPGKEHTYSSNLRAPSEPGKYAFQWRLAGGKGLFGEPTPKREITVLPRTTRDDPPATLPKADATGKRPLTPADVNYLGSFKLPADVGAGRSAYSETGMTLRRSKDGVPRMLITYSHPGGTLFEVDIPELARFEKDDASGLQTAAVVKEWGRLVSKAGGVGSNAGIAWDEDFQTLYWSHYNGYWTGGDIHVLHASTLNEDGTTTPVGSWKVPRQKWYWGGVTFLPKSFAKRYTDGNTLAIGFGGYFSIVAPCSRGPALSALRRPDPAGEQVTDVVNLLGYPQPDTAAPRPGDYFNVNCGFWNDPPKSRAAGRWTFCDWSRAGVLIDLADVQGFLAFPSLGTGRLGYDYGAITQAGTSQYWYFYDSRELGEIAQQKRQLGTVAPYIMQEDTGMRGLVTGACFDEATRRLYVLRMRAYSVDREMHPLVHVYQIGKAK